MQDEGQPGTTPGPQQPEAPTGPARYAYTPPDLPPNIEFKKVRRPDVDGPAAGSRRRPSLGGMRYRRWYLLPALGIVVALALSVGWVGVQGRRAANHLRTAAGLFVQLQQQIQQANVQAAKGTLAALQVETDAAHENTGGVGWAAASHVPIVGDDLGAVRTVSEVLADLAVNGLPALVDVAAGLDPATLAPQGGRIDLTALATAGPQIATGLAVIRRAQAEVAKIDRTGLTEEVGSAVIQLTSGLGKAERLTATADRAARLMPTMLGSDGPRRYLVLFQNNAEVRATGGMPGAYIVIRADAGAIEITDQGTAASDLKVFDKPVLPLDASMEALYTDRPAIFPANVNLTPDFPTAAALARRMYELRSGVAVDGVFATDPVALSYLLRVTGPVKMPKGEPLTADNAVRLLLSEAYAKYPNPVDQDAYFAGAARATFEALLKGQGDPKGIIAQLAQAAGERRLLMWSANEQEAASVDGTVLAGRLPADDGENPTVGVFLNDGSGSKLSYYLTQSAGLVGGKCADDNASRELRLKVTLGSTAPAAGLPAYVTGLGLSGDAYTVRTNVMVFSPTGGGVVSARLDGKDVPFGSGTERGRGVGVFTLDLPPASTKVLDVVVQTGALDPEADHLQPRLWTTPTVRPWKTQVWDREGCGADD